MSLQHAMVAFSALIYSIKVNHRAREIAFLYYSVALRELRLLLDKPIMDMTDCFARWPQHYSYLHSMYHILLNSADFSGFSETLQSVFDILKEPHALCNKSRIRCNYAQALSAALFSSGLCNSKTTAASLHHTNYCFLEPGVKRMFGYDIKLAIVEYPHLSDNERKARILDDVWPEFWLIVPELADVAYKVPKLKTLSAEARTAGCNRAPDKTDLL